MACSVVEGMFALFELFVMMASCVSGVFVYLLLRLRISFQSLAGFVRKLIVFSVSFHIMCCSCWISWLISLLSVCIRSRISGVGCCERRLFLVCIFNFM